MAPGVVDMYRSVRQEPQLPDETPAARRRSLERLYAAHHAQVFGYVLRRTGSADDAADVIAEVFLVAWRRIDEAPVGEDARLWLYGVARRVLANHRRGQRRRLQLADRLRGELAGRRTVDSADTEFPELAAAFSSLSARDREMLALEAWEELDAGEIAAVVGCSRNAARIRLHRAHQRLRAAIEASQIQVVAQHGERQHCPGEHRGEIPAKTIVVRGDIP